MWHYSLNDISIKGLPLQIHSPIYISPYHFVYTSLYEDFVKCTIILYANILFSLLVTLLNGFRVIFLQARAWEFNLLNNVKMITKVIILNL